MKVSTQSVLLGQKKKKKKKSWPRMDDIYKNSHWFCLFWTRSLHHTLTYFIGGQIYGIIEFGCAVSAIRAKVWSPTVMQDMVKGPICKKVDFWGTFKTGQLVTLWHGQLISPTIPNVSVWWSSSNHSQWICLYRQSKLMSFFWNQTCWDGGNYYISFVTRPVSSHWITKLPGLFFW